MHFTEIDLAAASAHAYQRACFADGDISAIGFQLRGAFDARGANVSTAGMQLGVAANVARLNEAARGV